jgi:Icc-related predicted phosphoesterase
MVAFPSNVLVISGYDRPHFKEHVRHEIDFVLSCGDVPFRLFEEIYERFNKPIFAVRGKNDPPAPFPDFVEDVHHRMIQHRRWLIGGWQGDMPHKPSGHPERDDMGADLHLGKFPYVDIFLCNAPLAKMAEEEDYAHSDCEAILKYIEEKQPQYVYHGRDHSEVGRIIGKTAVISALGAQVVTIG